MQTLVWKQANAESLRYVRRTQVSAGPLDLLALRGFTLPERIFIVGKNGATSPLPQDMRSP
ncbi:hypothetical protein EO087_05805 [Dyella sp. M7H15-1]|uniref:hypothetical protein n=1 Tax=Dyella sp. M7H15-1 TaxID=2501295 RepID=UPI001004F599|nr:hypothetical protein [Dyella sp. M7H15-1]QAU23560.1 hypothetical protein EO087_05805 [Dyella sp. M7H15-1]